MLALLLSVFQSLTLGCMSMHVHANPHKGSVHISFSLPFTKQLCSIFLKFLSNFHVFNSILLV